MTEKEKERNEDIDAENERRQKRIENMRAEWEGQQTKTNEL